MPREANSAAAVGGSGMGADANRGLAARGELVRLIAIGLITGGFSALFGVGGGVVIVPLLILLLAYDPARATATSLAAIVITASFAAGAHAALGNVRWGEALLIGIPAMVGVTVGVAAKQRVSSKALTIAFAIFLAAVAARIAIGGDVSALDDPGGGQFLLIGLLGVAAGVVAGLFGVGGGTVFVPALVLVGLGQLEAEATSLAAIVPVSLLGTWRQSRSEIIAWRDAAIIGGASTPTAVLGAFVADAAPERGLQLGFAGLLLFTAFTLIRRARSA